MAAGQNPDCDEKWVGGSRLADSADLPGGKVGVRHRVFPDCFDGDENLTASPSGCTSENDSPEKVERSKTIGDNKAKKPMPGTRCAIREARPCSELEGRQRLFYNVISERNLEAANAGLLESTPCRSE